MRNPVRFKKRYPRRIHRTKPLKTRLLSYIITYIGRDEIIHNSSLVRKALKNIVEDDKMWEKILNLNDKIKELAKYGLEQGY